VYTGRFVPQRENRGLLLVPGREQCMRGSEDNQLPRQIESRKKAKRKTDEYYVYSMYSVYKSSTF